jgi:hypothetical protein
MGLMIIHLHAVAICLLQLQCATMCLYDIKLDLPLEVVAGGQELCFVIWCVSVF